MHIQGHCFMIQLDPATVWMREEYGSRIFFPDATNTHFELPVNAECLIVEGAATVQGPSSASSGVQVVTPVTTGYTSGNRPIFSSNQKKSQTFNVKVVQASLKWLPNGRPEFKQMGQIFVDITEHTANVQYVQCVVQSRWGPDYILVTVDGLQLDDSPGTKGMFTVVLIKTCRSIILQY